MSPAPRLRVRRGSLRRVQLSRSGTPAGGSSLGSRLTSDRDRSALTLVVVLAVGITLGILHNRWRAHGRPDPVLAGVRLITYPFQAGGAHMEAGLFDGFSIMFQGRRLAIDNARLTAEVSRLTTENEALRLKAADDDRLRAAAGLLAHQPNPPLAADVIALLPTSLYDTITVSRGTHDGIHVQTIARTPAGLVGQVQDVGTVSSEVLLISDSRSEVGALLRRDGKVLGKGIIQGGGRSRPLKLIDLPRETDIRPGDEIVSSGDGGIFPPDVPIGTVISWRSEDAQFLKSALVAPSAGMPGALREVYLLRP